MFAVTGSSGSDLLGKPKERIHLTPDENDRIGFLRVFLVFMLVLVHFGSPYGDDLSVKAGYAGQDHAFAAIVISFLNFLGYTAVPALSVISGYLFFMGADRDTPPAFRVKMLRRVRSLVLPFLIWSGAFVLLGYVLFRFGGGYDTTFAPADGNLLRSLGDAWLGIEGYPLAIQLWFVRDLVLTVAISPVIWFLVGRAPILTLSALFVLWLSGYTLFIFTKLDVVGFFSLGAAFAMHGWRRDLPRRFAAPLLVVFLGLVLARTVLPYLLGIDPESHALYIATCLMRVVGLVAIWTAAPLLMIAPARRLVSGFGSLPFFIHCAHYPPIFLIKTAAGKLIAPESSAAHLFLYVGTVALTLIATVAAARLIWMLSPGLFSLLSGGRAQIAPAIYAPRVPA